MNKKKFKILSVIIAFALCFPLHFLYDKFPCFLTSIFFPVNESIWEHMKILFGSIILTGVIQKIITIIKKEKINNICFSNFMGAIFSIPLYLIMYLPIYLIFGENMILAIIIMVITIIVAEYISYILMEKEDLKLEHITVLFVIAVYILFTILTYHPFKNSLFIDSKTSSYGINK